MSLTGIDLLVVAGYAVGLLGLALWVSREPAGETKDTEDYFLAGKSLPWWAIGASLIAANISAEQIIGQSGQGYVVGLAIAAYEWQAALVLIIVAAFFLPVFLKRGIYTMPQFLDQRYGGGVKVLMSLYWIALYTLVNLTTVLWLGGLAVQSLTGLSIFWSMAALAGFASVYSLYGGLKAVALTDIIQVVILILGGIAITWISLSMVGGEAGPIGGVKTLYTDASGHFKMILSKDHPSYGDLPGIWTVLGGLWVLHFSYWGFNQYIIQRALGAETLGEAQKGLAFAACLKFLIPIIVVIPGIAALFLTQTAYGPVIDPALLDPALCADANSPASCGKPDRTYGVLMSLMPAGLRGLVFAALVAAIVSSLASMVNSIATIFTMDIYRMAQTGRTQHHYVTVGRGTAVCAMAIGLLAAQPFQQGFESGFQTVQEYTGFIAPGVVGVFLLGFFWKRANSASAFAVLIGSIAMNVMLKFYAADMPFVIRVWIVFLACVTLGVVIALAAGRTDNSRAVDLSGISFATSPIFKLAALAVMITLAGLYVVFW
ncbi:MAG: sodium/solute symporter [Pseudomonadota bacterium]